MWLRLALATLVVFVPNVVHAEPSFVTETVDAVAYNGINTSIALDSRSRPHITHYGYSADLKYARRDDSGWITEGVDSDATTCGWHSSLVLDTAGAPHITYHADQNFGRHLKYARREAQAWITEVVDWYVTPAWSSAEFDAFENLHVSYRAVNDGLMYARRVSGAWNAEIVRESFSGGGGWYSSLALDAQGNPRIAHSGYLNTPNQALEYAWKTGGTWNYEMVDSTGAWGSLELASDGSPCISYESDGTLMYARKRDGAWSRAVIDDSVERTGFCTSLRLDVSGRPYIAYQEGTNGNLRFAWRANGVWYKAAVDTGGNVGEYTSLALDSHGQPHISYRDITRDDLKYAYATWFTPYPEDGTAEIDENGDGVRSLRLSRPAPSAGVRLSAYPNPARSSVSMAYSAASGSVRDIQVYDASGRLLRRIGVGEGAGGAGTVLWDHRDDAGHAVAPGTYFLRLTTSRGDQVTERVTVLK